MEGAYESIESTHQIQRDEVVAAYQEIIEETGIKHPANLDLNNLDVKKVHQLAENWFTQEQKRFEGNSEKLTQLNISNMMLHVEAGFTDPDYLDEMLNDWLAQDSVDSPKIDDDPERKETRRLIAEATRKIHTILIAQNT